MLFFWNLVNIIFAAILLQSNIINVDLFSYHSATHISHVWHLGMNGMHTSFPQVCDNNSLNKETFV